MTTTSPTVQSRRERSGRIGRVDLVLLAGAMVAGTLLALYRIGRKQLWTDEGVAVGLGHEPLGRFLHVVTNYEVNQSPFYVVFRGWHVLGEDPAVMRSLSAVLAVATLPVVFALGRTLYGARMGAISAVVLALNGLVVAWSQQIRGYTMSMFLVTIATLLLVRLIDAPSTPRALLYAAVALASVATHFFSALVIVAHGVSLLILRDRPARVLRVAGVLLVAGALPVAWYVLTADTDPLQWIDDADGSMFVRTLSRIAGGRWALLLYAGFGTLGVTHLVRSTRSDVRSRAAFRVLLPLTCTAVPIGLGVAISIVERSVLVDRFYIGVLPAVALLVAVGITSLPSRALRIAALSALVVASLVGAVPWYGTRSGEDWQGAVSTLAAELAPGDAIVVPGSAASVAEYYARRDHDIDRSLDVPAPDERPDAERLWELRGPIVSEWGSIDAYARWRDRNFDLVETQTFGEVALDRYERRTT